MKTIPKNKEDEVLDKARSMFGIDGNATMGTDDGNIARVKISDAQFFPKPPSYWKESKLNLYNILSKDASEYIRSYDFNGLHVIASPAKYKGVEWLHVSFSRKSRIPDYKDIQLVRKDFIGTDKKSIMVFPDEAHYVNIAKYCLHLWYSAANPIPDFDVEIMGMRSI